jgi:tetratricopeptide (TPR) repeat protein
MDNSRIEDLRRRVQKEPASIAFAQLAEEYRRAGQFQDAVDTCRAGLVLHPAYLSARVTLGRSLLELEQLDAAQLELETVLRGAPENLAALRGLAELLRRRGELLPALARYEAALALARNDPELLEAVEDLNLQLQSAPAPDVEASEQMPAEPLRVDPGLPGLGREQDRALRTIAVLDQWLAAIHVARAERPA